MHAASSATTVVVSATLAIRACNGACGVPSGRRLWSIMTRPGWISAVHCRAIFLTVHFRLGPRPRQTNASGCFSFRSLNIWFTVFLRFLLKEMGVEKAFVAQRVANKLFATESAIDAAMVETMEMTAELIQARKDLELSSVVANGATAKLADAVAALAAARTAVVEAHAELDEVRLRIGIRTKLIGVISKPTGSAVQTDLRVAV